MRPRLSAGLSLELASLLLARDAAKTRYAHWFAGSLRVLQAPYPTVSAVILLRPARSDSKSLCKRLATSRVI